MTHENTLSKIPMNTLIDLVREGESRHYFDRDVMRFFRQTKKNLSRYAYDVGNKFAWYETCEDPSGGNYAKIVVAEKGTMRCESLEMIPVTDHHPMEAAKERFMEWLAARATA